MIMQRTCFACGMAFCISDKPADVWQDNFCWPCVKSLKLTVRKSK